MGKADHKRACSIVQANANLYHILFVAFLRQGNRMTEPQIQGTFLGGIAKLNGKMP